MDEKHGTDSSSQPPDESSQQRGDPKSAYPLSGGKPTGQSPQGAGGDPRMGDPGSQPSLDEHTRMGVDQDES